MDIVVSRYVLIALAILSAGMYAYRRQWENVITRLITAGIFIGVMAGMEVSNATVNFLIRWSFIMIFGVELLSWTVRSFGASLIYRLFR